MNLSTKYLGLALAHPFMAGASLVPSPRQRKTARGQRRRGDRVALAPRGADHDGGLGTHSPDGSADPQFAAILSAYPPAERYALAPDEYLEHIRRVKDAVHIPVLGSLNGVTGQAWLRFARDIEQAGADALELNMFEVAADPADSGPAIETRIRDVTANLKANLSIPVAVKLSPYFTAFGHFARQLDGVRADGLVLFNRFYQPDIDLIEMTAAPRVELSTSAELLLRLRWISALHGRVRASLALTGGVATPQDGLKALLAGAHAVQLVSAVLRQGPAVFTVMREGLVRWMEARQLTSIDEVRGRVALEGVGDLDAVARAAYLRTLQSWPTTG